MSLHQIEESAVTGLADISTVVPVRVLSDNGSTARVLVEGAGIFLRQGQEHAVPSTALQPRR